MILDMSVRASVISVLLLSILLVVGCGRDDHPIHGTYTAIQFLGRPLPYHVGGFVIESVSFEISESGDCGLSGNIVYSGEEEEYGRARVGLRWLGEPLACRWEIDELGDEIRLRLFETGGPNSNPGPFSSEWKEVTIRNGLLSIGRDWIFQKN